MTNRRLIDTADGVSSYYHFEQPGQRIIEFVQDATSIVENNKRLANEGRGYSKSKDFRRMASIPNIITLKWLHEDGVYWPRLPKREMSKYLRRKLSDPQYRYLRTSGGGL